MCGHQCDKSVTNKINIHEVIWYRITVLKCIISLHGLISPIKQTVIIGWTNRVARYILADAWRQIWREELL